jgi:hypothetical protein
LIDDHHGVLEVEHAVDHVEVDDHHGVREMEHAVDHVEVDDHHGILEVDIYYSSSTTRRPSQLSWWPSALRSLSTIWALKASSRWVPP